MPKKKESSDMSFLINDEIRGYDFVRIVGNNIESKVVSLKEAKELAEKMETDLVLINQSTNPPITKIGDYHKMLYEIEKSKKKNKTHTAQLKEIQLSVNIAENDLKVKAKKAKEFILNGDKVKVVLSMKGRELLRREESKRSIYQFIVELEDCAIPESQLKEEGNRTIVILKKKK